jgi:glycosyltransferase involved in cell wall biosynthesis
VATRDTVRAAAAALGSTRCDVVFVMRLYLAPFADSWLDVPERRRPRLVIDLDDDEVRTHRSLAALHEANGDAIGAGRETREAERYARFEREYLPRFDRVLVAAPADQAALEARLPLGTTAVVPNAVRVPALVPGPRPAAWRLLFVGSLGYPPNADAAKVLCRTILPRLRSGSGRHVEVEIVGTNPTPEVATLDELPGVTVGADVPSVSPYYARSRGAVAPIRAGGGTRIKLLEAFAHRCPVVATRVAAEGLDVQDGVHLLLADEPDHFARACLELLARDDLAERLTDAGRSLVESRYALPLVAHQIRELYRDLSRG